MQRIRKLSKLLDSEIRAKNLEVARLYLRERYWRLSGQQMPDPVFILGCSRSGTTVTYETIAASSHFLSFGYEIPQFWDSLWGPKHNGWTSEAADESNADISHRDAAFSHVFARLGKGLFLDKTCINALRGRYLYKLFPNAKFIYIQRDGRDNISSMMDGWRQDGHFGLTQFLGPSPDSVSIEDGEFQEWSFFLPPGWRDYNNARLEEVCAFQWIAANRSCLAAKEIIPESQWIHVRYEDLFTRPLEMFEGIFNRLQIPFEEKIRERCQTLDKRPTSIVKGAPKLQKWKRHNPEAISRIMDTICPLQKELGYDCEV